MSERLLNRRDFFKLAVPASLLRQEYQPPYPEENSPRDDLNASDRVLDLLDPSQYDQAEFNQMAAIGISVSLEGLGNLNRRLHEMENRFPPPHITLPQDSQGDL